MRRVARARLAAAVLVSAALVSAARADVAASDPDEADAYDRAAPYWHCYLGLERYWRKRRETATAST